MAWDYIDTTIKKANKNGKAILSTIQKGFEKEILDSFFYADEKWKGKGQLLVKITDKSVLEKIANKLKKYIVEQNRTKGYFIVVNDDFRGRFQLSGGLRGTGRLERAGEKAKLPTTAQQETGTIYTVVRYAKTKKLPTLREISEFVGYQFSPEWEHNFHRQAELIVGFVGANTINKSDVLLDSDKRGRHNLFYKYAHKLGVVDDKDNWNPSDIWVVDKTLSEARIRKELDAFSHYGQVNAWLERMFEEGRVVGISLKKIGLNSKGHTQIVSLRNVNFNEIFTVRKVKYNPFYSNFIPEASTDSGAVFMVRTGFKSSSDAVSVYLEGRIKGAGVQLGAVSRKLFTSIAKKYSDYDVSRQMSKSEPFSDKRHAELSEMISKMSRGSKVFGLEYSPKEFEKKLAEIKEDQIDGEKLLRRAYNLTLFASVFDSAERKGNFQKLMSDCYYSAKKQNKFSSIHLKVS